MMKNGKRISAIFLTIAISLVLWSCGGDDPVKPSENAPVINSLSPSDSAKIGAQVTISGNYFGDSRGTSTVSFNGTAVDAASGYVSWSNTEIKFTIPTGATSGNITVKVGENISNGKYLKIYTGGSIIDEKDTLLVSSVDKDSAKVGDNIVITGKGFGDSKSSGSYVSFGSVKATTYPDWRNETITVIVPEGAVSGNITVTRDDTTSNAFYFKIYTGGNVSIPSITSISPTEVGVDSLMTIEGTNFGASRADGYVDFGGVQAADYSLWTDTKIIVKVPATAKSGNVKVVANQLSSNEKAYTIKSVNAGDPQITYLDINKIDVGAKLGINGKNFGDTQGTSTVKFNDTYAVTYTSWKTNKIIVIVPDLGGATTASVTVTVNGITSNAVSVEIKEEYVYLPLILVNKGSFSMGPYDDGISEAPAHNVTISNDFYISKSEISQEQFKYIMDQSNPSKIKNDKNPVEQLTWIRACEFCNKLSEEEGRTKCYTINGSKVTCDFSAKGYRLPTEAEWEYACRAGQPDPSDIEAYAWTSANCTIEPHEIMKKSPNAWGIYDMHGNVYEWCWDYYDSEYYSSSPSTDPTGPTSDCPERVIRGGSFSTSNENCASNVRGSHNPETPEINIGFRVVRKK